MEEAWLVGPMITPSILIVFSRANYEQLKILP